MTAPQFTMAQMAAHENKAVAANWLIGTGRINKACEALGMFTRAAEHIQMVEIVDEVAAVTGIPVSEIMGRSRQAKIANARQIAMWECHGANISYTRIGRFFDRDHTTVMHAVKVIRDVMRNVK